MTEMKVRYRHIYSGVESTAYVSERYPHTGTSKHTDEPVTVVWSSHRDCWLEALTVGVVCECTDCTVPTLGEIAETLRKLLEKGVSRGSMLYVVDKVWWEQAEEEARAEQMFRKMADEVLRDSAYEYGITNVLTDNLVLGNVHRQNMDRAEAEAWVERWIADGGKPDVFCVIRRKMGVWESHQ